MKVYYAHCMAIYGTPQEARDIATLEALGLTVVNPNTPECDAGYIAQGMDYFKRFVTECDAIAFRAVPDGRIPAGIWREIQMFRESPGVSKPAPAGTYFSSEDVYYNYCRCRQQAADALAQARVYVDRGCELDLELLEIASALSLLTPDEE